MTSNRNFWIIGCVFLANAAVFFSVGLAAALPFFEILGALFFVLGGLFLALASVRSGRRGADTAAPLDPNRR